MRINEVCDILQIKSHVLRYWEQQIAVLRPSGKTTPDGQNDYSLSDLELLLHFKYLIYQKMCTIEEALKILLNEEYERDPQYMRQLSTLRRKMLRLLCTVKYGSRRMQDITDPPPGPHEVNPAGAHADSE